MTGENPTESDGYFGNVSFENVIYIQLLKVGNLSLKLYEIPSGNWQRNVINYFYSIKSLEALIFPYLNEDDYYKTEVDIAVKEAREKYRKLKKKGNVLTKVSKYDEMNLTIELSNTLLSLMTEKLKKKGLLIPNSMGITYEG